MGPLEVRAIRGNTSRAAFAAKLGVTPLTVYRWELPADAAEARSPRGRHLAALKQLADPTYEPPQNEAQNRVLSDLARARWDVVEQEALAEVAGGHATSPDRHAFVAVAIAQARVIGHLDARGAYLMLTPALASWRLLPGEIAARAHIVAAMIHAASHEPLYNLGKVTSHLASARALAPSDSVTALATVVELDALSRVDGVAFARTFGRVKHEFETFAEPVTRVLALEVQAAAMRIAGDMDGERRQLGLALAAAKALGFAAAEARILADLARVAHLTAGPDEALLRCDEATDAIRRTSIGSGLALQIERTRTAVYTSKEVLSGRGTITRANIGLDEPRS